MKRKRLIIPAGLLFFIMLIWTSSGYGDSRFLFVVRNLLIFGVIVYFVVEGQLLIRDSFLKNNKFNNKQANIIKVSVGILGAIVLVTLSSIQVTFLTNQEVYFQIGCEVYFKNIHIHTSDTVECSDFDDQIETSLNETDTLYSIVYDGYPHDEYYGGTTPYIIDIVYGEGYIKSRNFYTRKYEYVTRREYIKVSETTTFEEGHARITQWYYEEYIKGPFTTIENSVKNADFTELMKEIRYDIYYDKSTGNIQIDMTTIRGESQSVRTIITGVINEQEGNKSMTYTIKNHEGTFQDVKYLISDETILVEIIDNNNILSSTKYNYGEDSSLLRFKPFSSDDEAMFMDVERKETFEFFQLVGANLMFEFVNETQEIETVLIKEVRRDKPEQIQRHDNLYESFEYYNKITEYDEYHNKLIYQYNPLIELAVMLYEGGESDE